VRVTKAFFFVVVEKTESKRENSGKRNLIGCFQQLRLTHISHFVKRNHEKYLFLLFKQGKINE
jgi:hypothetical protein